MRVFLRRASIACMIMATLSVLFLPISGVVAAEKDEQLLDQSEDIVIDVNSSSVETLQQVKGIGPKLAERIVQFREENGAFESIEEIMNVRGIGKAKFQRIEQYLEV